MSKGGRPQNINEEQYEVLRQIVAERPLTLSEIARELAVRTGIQAHEATVRKALRAAGLRRIRGEAAVERQTRAPTRCDGYTAAHRRHDPDQGYPSCQTDAEWALVADLFEPVGGRGVGCPIHAPFPARRAAWFRCR